MDYSGKKAAFYTLGCKLNFSETSSIARRFEDVGFERIEFSEKADVVVINSCSVTAEGDKKTRNIIRQAIRRNPDSVIVVTGCYAQLQPETIQKIEGVDLIVGSAEKLSIPEYLGDLTKKAQTEIHIQAPKQIKNYFHAYSFGDRTRSFLKVQDGCDYYCTYCTIPFARGRSRNDSIANTVAEAREIVAKGTLEIILTGVNIGDFGKSTGEEFIDLLKELDKIEDLRRIRISSVEPNLLTDEVIEFVARSQRIMPHFHLPLQSGSNDVLALMKRKYKREVFESRVEKIKKELPSAFVGVDVIAGTNGETDEFFRDSYRFIADLEVSQLHAFPYSERPGTKALEIKPVVPVEERKQRTQRLIALSERKTTYFYQQQLGTTHEVLFEEQKDKVSISGFTENYIRVETSYNKALENRIVSVKLENILPNGNVWGSLVEQRNS
ncbi:MAG TPA: tRNA (N(6)-L-threonylcarbamoyladenosine(37)-C(2))-methylthiotransferase MtaB [Prolixibacteraceae bacterium]|nr:tRNA (N(6)-L-threonylcarbamoyladenosine(37)-C(2))-methylthiotransferase MtaB [Prolixibacteraceae bacterium]